MRRSEIECPGLWGISSSRSVDSKSQETEDLFPGLPLVPGEASTTKQRPRQPGGHPECAGEPHRSRSPRRNPQPREWLHEASPPHPTSTSQYWPLFPQARKSGTNLREEKRKLGALFSSSLGLSDADRHREGRCPQRVGLLPLSLQDDPPGQTCGTLSTCLYDTLCSAKGPRTQGEGRPGPRDRESQTRGGCREATAPPEDKLLISNTGWILTEPGQGMKSPGPAPTVWEQSWEREAGEVICAGARTGLGGA